MRLSLSKNLLICASSWPPWVSVAARGLSLAVTSGSCSWLRCTGFSLLWCLQLQNAGLWGTWISVAPWLVGSSQARDRARVTCIGRQNLNPQTTRGVPAVTLSYRMFCPPRKKPPPHAHPQLWQPRSAAWPPVGTHGPAAGCPRGTPPGLVASRGRLARHCWVCGAHPVRALPS